MLNKGDFTNAKYNHMEMFLTILVIKVEWFHIWFAMFITRIAILECVHVSDSTYQS